MAFFVPTRFVWRFGGRQVHLCGSFTRWVETIPMAAVEGTPGVFSVVVHLPPGYHQYKFIVDGKWMHDETAPYMPDPLSNINNWLFVRRIDPPAAQQGMPYEQQAAIMQQLQEQQQQAAAAALNQQQQQQAAQAQAAQAQAAQAQAAVVQAIQQQQAVVQQLQAQLPQHHQQQQLQPMQIQQAAANFQQRAGPSIQQQQSGGSGGVAVAVAGGGDGGGGGGSGAGGGVLHPSMMQTSGATGGASSSLQPAAQQRLMQPAGGASNSPVHRVSGDGDVDMAAADSVVAPIIIHNEREPDLTKKKVSDFLHSHSAYELIPESGKVVLLDIDLPIRQAFHALHEQGIASSPLWDGTCGAVVGVISASDFIHTLRRLRHAVSSGNNPLSEAEMDAHTIRGMREECCLEGRPPKPLVYVRPSDNLAKVVRTLFNHKCSMAPILSAEPSDPSATVLHIATLSGVLNCLMRHFRASLASLPLLAQPLGQLPVGTWAPEHQFNSGAAAAAAAGQQSGGLSDGGVVLGKGGAAAAVDGGGDGGGGGGDNSEGSRNGIVGRNVTPLHAVTHNTPLTTALGMLLEAGVSALPVVSDAGVLLDIYARADITKLCKGNAYNRLQWEDVTVGQALSLSSNNPAAWQQASAGSGGHLLVPDFAVQSSPHLGDHQLRGGSVGGGYQAHSLAGGRVAVAFQDDPLRAVVERLAAPGVRRLVVVDRGTRRVQGLVSLSDVAAYLFL